MKFFLAACVWIILLCLAFPGVAQQTDSKISGMIRDASGPIEKASVSLFENKDSSLVKIVLSAHDGRFEFEAVPKGDYFISVTAVGHQPYSFKSFNIAGSGKHLELPETLLEKESASLGAVTVTGKRPLVETRIDKTIVNVEASISNAGNSAMEVLEKSPNVMVDKDGNIKVKGKTGVIILIDGKQTYLSGQDLVDYLKNMPASTLDQIEIMTQPSAKYDASGNAGIINIKTKKNQSRGFNGSVTLSYVQAIYPKSPNNVTFNYRTPKFNFFGNGSYAYWRGFSDININRYFLNTQKDINTHFQQQSSLGFKSHPGSLRLGLDFFADSMNTIGVVLNGQTDTRRTNVSTTSKIFDLNNNGALSSYSNAYTTNKTPFKNFGANLNFKHNFDKKGKELTADFDYALFDTRSDQTSDNYTYYPDGTLDTTAGSINPYLLRGHLPSLIHIYTGKADYTHPLKHNDKFEAGWKSSYVKTDNDAQYAYLQSGILVPDVTRTNHFLYEENINAVYANYNRQIGKWGIQTGLRMEHTHAKGNQVISHQKFDTSYVQLFPTAYVSYAPTDKNTFGLSYGRRIDRPNYSDMNPFQYFLDQYTYRQGNPYLRPQFSHNIEVSYNHKGELNVSVNYTITNNVISDVLKQNDSTKVTYQTLENVAKQVNVGLSVNYNKQLTKILNVSLSGQLFNDHYTGIVNDSYLDVSRWAFGFNGSFQFKFKKGWGSELSGFYDSKQLNSGLIVSSPMYVFGVAFSKQVLKEKGTIKLNFRDPFYVMRYEGYTRFSNLNVDVRTRWDNRRIALTFTYRFGKQFNNAPTHKKEASAEEQNRAGGGGGQQQ